MNINQLSLRAGCMAIAVVVTLLLAACGDPPEDKKELKPVSIELATSLKHKLNGAETECLKAVEELIKDIAKKLGMTLDGKKITLELVKPGGNAGAETKPVRGDKNAVKISIRSDFCTKFSDEIKRMILAHELEHALDFFKKDSKGRKARVEAQDAEKAKLDIGKTAPDTAAGRKAKLKALVEALKKERALKQATLEEEKRIYPLTKSKHQGKLGLSDKVVSDNEKEGKKAVEELEKEIKKLDKMIKRYEGLL